jgi:S-adenosylmethionine:tRNA ribosyltransferase-isomerase
VLNQSRVITARLLLTKEHTGGKAEVLCLHPTEPAADPAVALAARSGQSVWRCMIGGKHIRPGQRLVLTTSLGGGSPPRQLNFVATVEARDGKEGTVRFSWSGDDATVSAMCFGQVLEAVGKIPLPPYMHRASDAADARDYQTVYARAEGSVAAPTAGGCALNRVFWGIGSLFDGWVWLVVYYSQLIGLLL